MHDSSSIPYSSTHTVLEEALLNDLTKRLQENHLGIHSLINRSLLRELPHFEVLERVDFITQKERDQIVSCILIAIIANINTNDSVAVDQKLLKKTAQCACYAAAYLQESANHFIADNTEIYAKIKIISYVLLASANAIAFANVDNNEEYCKESAMYAFLYTSLGSGHQIELENDLREMEKGVNFASTPLFCQPKKSLEYIEQCRSMTFFSADIEALIYAYDNNEIAIFAFSKLYKKSVALIAEMNFEKYENMTYMAKTNEYKGSKIDWQERAKNIYVIGRNKSSIFNYPQAQTDWHYLLEKNMTLPLSALLSYNQSGKAINLNVLTDEFDDRSDSDNISDVWVDKLHQTLAILNIKKWHKVTLDVTKEQKPNMTLSMLIFQSIWQNGIFSAMSILLQFACTLIWRKHHWKAVSGLAILGALLYAFFQTQLHIFTLSPDFTEHKTSVLIIEVVALIFLGLQGFSLYANPYGRFLIAKDSKKKTDEKLKPYWKKWQRDLNLLLAIIKSKKSSQKAQPTILIVLKNIDHCTPSERNKLWKLCDTLSHYSFIEVIKVFNGRKLIAKEPAKFLNDIETQKRHRGFSIYLNAQELIDDIANNREIERITTIADEVLHIDEQLTEQVIHEFWQSSIDATFVNNFGHMITLFKLAQYSQLNDENNHHSMLSNADCVAILQYCLVAHAEQATTQSSTSSLQGNHLERLTKHFML